MTTSGVIAAVASGVLAGVFVASGIAKLRDRVATASAMRALRLPPSSGESLAAIELFTAFGLLMERSTPWSAVVAGVLLTGFTAIVSLNLVRGNRVPCPCFGSSPAPIGGPTIARNVGLLALSVVATEARGSAWWIAWLVAAPVVALVDRPWLRSGFDR